MLRKHIVSIEKLNSTLYSITVVTYSSITLSHVQIIFLLLGRESGIWKLPMHPIQCHKYRTVLLLEYQSSHNEGGDQQYKA
mmetsp:Transcript_17005/g.19568  ORF Transcript_17005/g.19568 Transcript_17005/m.19568 type:complete len:81 (-) Transcript_17005:320-562(-)